MAQIQPPETFDFSTPNEWPKWRKRFERYLVVSGMKKKEEADKIDLFMYLMGDRADDIFRTFKFEKEEEATKIDSVLKAFDSHFCVRKNIIYERAKFNSRIQEDREPVDEFITSLYKLADSCEFEGLHEQLIRDRIVVGVRDKALSERMQLDSELTLEKAVKMVRQQEAVRQQQVDLQRPSTSQKVNQVKFNSKKHSPKQQQQPSRKKEKSAKTRSRCPKCGGFTHREGQACRAEGQRCNLCSKTGHFANCCPDKQAKTAEVKAVSELDGEIGFLLEVSAVEDSSNLDNDEDECRRRWTAEIQVNGKKVKFKLDSQADVTCVPLCLFKKIMGQQRLVESDINIRAAEFSELQTVGMFISTLRNGSYEIKEKIYVIRRLSEPLLSRRACELLNLARRIEVVATRINPIKEFPEVFEGLGQIGNPYEIKLKPGEKPYAVHTPRRVPIPLMEKLKTRLEELDKDDILTKIFEAQQENTTLKAVVNYLEQGWPDKKKMSHALLSYWHVKDELGVQNGLLMRSCRLVIPASMRLEILDKLHAGHFGITKTRLRARETVWWPGISEEIAETVRKCSVCIQEAVSKHEPLIPTNFPTRPWQKIGMDLFKFENKWYLVVIDYYSRFPEMIQLDRLTASVVVRSCKSIFARHGIPETVVSDNGTQFGAAREFANFARQYGFQHVTSSPRFPQSNGMAEAGVKIAKLILKKNQDPSLGLLEYRSTPLENGYSPAELLMGRKLRTTLPIAPENLNPKLVDSQTLKRKEGRRRKDMKSRYDRRCGATDMEELSEGDTVWITDMRTWGIVKQKASTPRSYMVDTPVGTLRRNRFHLRKGVTVQYPADPSTPTFSGEELVENEKTPVVDHPSNDSEDGQIRTRSGRIVKPYIQNLNDKELRYTLLSAMPTLNGRWREQEEMAGRQSAVCTLHHCTQMDDKLPTGWMLSDRMVETRSGKMQDPAQERIKAEESAKPQPGATIGRDASSDPVVLNPNIDIPKYDGTEDPRPWIESLEEIGFLYHWADYITSRYAAMNMIGSAKTWLNLHKVSFTSWENFKSRLIEDFASDANKEEMRMRLNRIQQWNEPAIRFAEDILVLCNKVDPQMEEETKINWVIGGLKKEYSFALHLNPPKNTNELLEICKKLDLFEKNYQERAEKSKALYNGPRSPRPHHQEQWKNATSFRRPYQNTSKPQAPAPRYYQNTSKPQAPTPRYYQNKPLPQVSAPRRSYTPNPEPKPVYPSKTYNKNPNSNRNRTEDGRPICFKCNKPGHVARYCRVRIGICEALIDTGADLSVVDLSTALNTGLEIINPDKMCSGPDGKELDIVGNIILNIKFDDKTITHQFVIMRTHLRIFILGRDFLKKMNAKIDCQREIIKYDLTENRDVIKYQQKKIKSAKDAIIPELSIKLINAFVEAEDGEYIIEENHKMFQTNGLRLARSLINVVNKETYIWITNPYPRPLKILKNQTLCFGSQPAEVNLMEESEQKEHEEPQFQINENLAYTEKEQLKQVLERYEDLFSSGLGRSNLAKHRIDTENAKPIKHKPYRVSAKEREIIKEQIDEMLRDGIIRPSSSPWSFPVILVKKRDGKYRFCVDYRKLNDVTVKDVYPIPRIDEVLDTLQGSKYFSAIDLKSGYWQVEVEEKDKEKTAFTTAHGLYEFNVMPFGLCNAPATFERNMENMLGNLRWQICLCYLDDVIIYSSDFSTHLKRIEAVLKCFREANLKLNNKKCQFAFEELEILGHITNQHGIKPAEHNIKAIRDFPRPKKIKEVQSFLGMCSYYRKFIKGFSKIADPLTSLIKKNVPFTWTENQEKAFQTLKVALINPPILGHFDPNAITYIHTDASNIGLGATLVQKFGDKEKVISYLSRTLSKPEQNYSTTEKECLAVVWSMSKLRPYLYGRHFKIVTDHHALCWLKNLKDPTGRLARWALKIQEYNFEIIHKSGKKHLDADGLSRGPLPENEWDEDYERLFLNQIIDEKDDFIENIKENLSGNKRSITQNFKEENGCLYKKNPNPEGRAWLLVVPKKRRKEVMSEYHNHMLNGHLGVARTTYRLKNKYYWPSMLKDVSEFVKTCHLCQSRKGSNHLPSGLLQPIPPANYPFERIGIDFVGPLPSTKRRRKWIIVLTDYYTKYAETKAVSEATVKEVSTFLIEHIILRHGAPRFLISDRGSQFTSNLMKEVMKMCKVKHCFTTSYHPQTNGLTERLNRTLINMISMYVNTDQKNWDEILPFITHAYNTTIQETTGYSPFFLLFGREPMSLLDDENIPTDSNMDDYDEYIENYLDKIARTRQVVINNTEKTQERMKRNYDKKHNEKIYEPGHLVAVWTPVRKIGKCEKLLRKYFGPYRILKKLSNVNYLIEPKDNPGQDPLIVHVSRLKPYFERIDEVTHEDVTTSGEGEVMVETRSGKMQDPAQERIKAEESAKPQPDPEPDMEDKSSWEIWSDKNDEAFGIIITTLTNEQAGMFIGETNAKKVWDSLRKTYTGNLEDKIIDIGLELKDIKMKDNETVDEYITRAKNIAARSSSLGHQFPSRELSFHIVRGIHPRYENIAIVLRSKREATIEEIQQTLREEESRRNMRLNQSVENGHEQAYRIKNRKVQQFQPKRCFVCNKKGHLANDCWFRDKQKQGYQKKWTPGDRNHKYSREHSNNLVDTMKSGINEQAFETYVKEFEDSPDERNDRQIWCIDSGCTAHLTPNLTLMENVVDYESDINLAEKGKTTQAIAKGDMRLTTCTSEGQENIRIKDILHVPSLRNNFLSVYELVNKGNSVIFNKDGAKIYNEGNDLVAEAYIKDRMFMMETKQRNVPIAKNENVMVINTHLSNKKSNISLWHKRLNHINEEYMKKMIQGHIVRGLDLKFERLPECEACIMGKLVQKPYTITDNYTVKPLQLIHMDLCGPMPCQSLGGSKYFLVIVDDYSRRIFVYFLRSKDETFERFEEFKARAENELSLRIKDLRTDNGTEFCNSRFEGLFKRSGIHHQLTTTYSPQSNGVAERVNRTLIDTALGQDREVKSVKFSEDKRGIDYANDIQEDTNCDNLTYKGNCEEIVEDFLILKEDNPVTESKMKSQEDTSVKLGGDCENDSSQTEPIQERCVKGGRMKGETKSILEEWHKARLEEQERKLIEEGVRRSQRIKDRNNANLIMEIDHYIPENFKEAMDSGERNEWHKAMEDELSEIEKHKVWTLVPRENDDLIIAGTSKEINDNLASEIEKYVTLTEKKDSEPFIGIEIKREEDGFYLSQTHYIDTILHRFGLEECNSVQTPGDQNQNLDEYLDPKPVDKTVYQEMIGSLMYTSLRVLDRTYPS
ncbi:hypothetical protein LAZ67_3005530, partial [Cordylochernes scorpioides]